MISVIVPVYKVENYLDKCVKSILAQTYRDFELLLIDDGSPDNCPQLCDEYAARYDCVRTLHKKNGGLSDARNFGVAHAKGEFVSFVDSDDYVGPRYLETLDRLRKMHKCDIAVTGIATFFSNDIPKEDCKVNEYIYTGIQALEKMLYQDTLDTSACAMLIPIEIAKKNQFPVGKYHEDEFTTYKYYMAVNKVAVTTCKQYFYLQRNGSIMHVFGKSSVDELDAADNLVEVCKKNCPNIVAAAESKKFSDYCQVFLANSNLKNDYPNIYNRIDRYLKTIRVQIFMDKKCRKKNRIAALLLFGGYTPLKIANKLKKR